MISKDNYAAAISFTIVCLMNFIDNGLISYGFFPYVLIGIYSMYRGTAEITNRYKLRSRKKSN
jgi:pilus assembly protein TadC